jgi:hypothetical protein
MASPLTIPSAAFVGQARTHMPQSMHVSWFTLTLYGLKILGQPAEKPEGTDPHAEEPVPDDGQPEDQEHDDRRGHAEIPFEKLEGVEVAVNGLVLKPGIHRREGSKMR